MAYSYGGLPPRPNVDPNEYQFTRIGGLQKRPSPGAGTYKQSAGLNAPIKVMPQQNQGQGGNSIYDLLGDQSYVARNSNPYEGGVNPYSDPFGFLNQGQDGQGGQSGQSGGYGNGLAQVDPGINYHPIQQTGGGASVPGMLTGTQGLDSQYADLMRIGASRGNTQLGRQAENANSEVGLGLMQQLMPMEAIASRDRMRNTTKQSQLLRDLLGGFGSGLGGFA